MIQHPPIKDFVEEFDQLDPVEDAQIAFGFDGQSEMKDGSASDDELQRRGQNTLLHDKARKSVVEAVMNAIDTTVGNRVYELQVLLEDDCVIVKATTPSFYVRQLVEHKSRSVVVEHLNKRFVSRVVVKN